LRERVGLGGWGDKFIVGVVSRLTGQKGVPLIKHAAFRTVERGGQFVLLGSAPDPKVQVSSVLTMQIGGTILTGTQGASQGFSRNLPQSKLDLPPCSCNALLFLSGGV